MEDMAFYHKPVLFRETIDSLHIRPDGVYIDGTAGGGGHSEAILQKLESGKLLSIDQDPDAIAVCQKRFAPYGARSLLRQGNFADMVRIAGEAGCVPCDGVLLDIGVSSHQLDTPERGFSYHYDAPLDMRMSQSGPTAADLLRDLPEQEIARILREYGEEKAAAALPTPLFCSGPKRPLPPHCNWQTWCGNRYRPPYGAARDTPPGKPSRPCALP